MKRETKNVTVNRNYDRHVRKIQKDSVVKTVLSTESGKLILAVITIMISLVLFVFGVESLETMYPDFMTKVNSVAQYVSIIFAGLLILRQIIVLLIDSVESWSVLKYSVRVPKTVEEVALLQINTLGEYLKYLLTNLFITNEVDGVLDVRCPFCSYTRVSQAINVGISYYQSIQKAYISKEDLLWLTGESSTLRINAPKHLALFRWAAYLAEDDSVIARNGKVRVWRSADSHLHTHVNRLGKTVNLDIDVNYGGYYHGFEESTGNVVLLPDLTQFSYGSWSWHSGDESVRDIALLLVGTVLLAVMLCALGGA